MVQILGITAVIFIGIYMIFEALHIYAILTLKGKLRLIDKFIGFFDNDYKEMCIEYIEAYAEYAEMKRQRR